MMVVSVLSVEDPVLFEQIALAVPLDDHTLAARSPTERVVDPAFERLLPELERRGLSVLVRTARRPDADRQHVRDELRAVIDDLSDPARELLHRAQRHARDQVVLGVHVFDPETDRAIVEELVASGLLEVLADDGADGAARFLGRFALHPDTRRPRPCPGTSPRR